MRANQARVGRSGRSPAALASGRRLELGKTDRQDFGAVIPALSGRLAGLLPSCGEKPQLSESTLANGSYYDLPG